MLTEPDRLARRRAADAGRAARAETPDGERIVLSILRAVEELRLPPGTKLAEAPLASLYGVSRARVRQALQQLAHRHIVTLHPNRGAFVAEPPVAEARAVFAARRLVEPPLAGSIVGRLNAPQLARLRRHVAREDAARSASDLHAGIKLSGEFHVVVAEIAGNPVVTDIVRGLVARSSLIVAVYQRSDAFDCGPDDHRDLIGTLVSGSRRQAARLMERHLRHVEAALSMTPPRTRSVDLRAILATAVD